MSLKASLNLVSIVKLLNTWSQGTIGLTSFTRCMSARFLRLPVSRMVVEGNSVVYMMSPYNIYEPLRPWIMNLRFVYCFSVGAQAGCQYHIWVAKAQSSLYGCASLSTISRLHQSTCSSIWVISFRSQEIVQKWLEKSSNPAKPITSFAANADTAANNCILCKAEKHRSGFKDLTHDKKLSTLTTNRVCLNCLQPGHFIKDCKSLHRCRKCQKPHHTLLHVDVREEAPKPIHQHLYQLMLYGSGWSGRSHITGTMTAVTPNFLRGECTDETMKLVVNLVEELQTRPATSEILALWFKVNGDSATVTRKRMMQKMQTRWLAVPFNVTWSHLSNIQLADPGFGHPGEINLLLGVEVFVEVMLHGRRSGVPGSALLLKRNLDGFLLAALTPVFCSPSHYSSCFTSHWRWSLGDRGETCGWFHPNARGALSLEIQHSRMSDGRFIRYTYALYALYTGLCTI